MPVIGPTCNTGNPVRLHLDKHGSQTDIGGEATVWNVPLTPGAPLTVRAGQARFDGGDMRFELGAGKYWVQVELVMADIGMGSLFEYSLRCGNQTVFVEQSVLDDGKTVGGREGWFRLNVGL